MAVPTEQHNPGAPPEARAERTPEEHAHGLKLARALGQPFQSQAVWGVRKQASLLAHTARQMDSCNRAYRAAVEEGDLDSVARVLEQAERWARHGA